MAVAVFRLSLRRSFSTEAIFSLGRPTESIFIIRRSFRPSLICTEAATVLSVP